jgi:ABC-type branched-subunit amino acid transport system ATPase component
MKNSIVTNKRINNILVIWKYLPLKIKRSTVLTMFLSLIGTLIEAIGVGLMVPALSLMADQKNVDKYSPLQPLIRIIGEQSQSRLIIYGILILLLVYIFKAVYLGFLSLNQAKYIYNMKAYVSLELYKNHMNSQYEFILRNNSASLIINLTTEMQQFVNGVLIPVVLITSEISVTTVLAIMLFYHEPIGATAVIVLIGTAVYLFQRVTGKKLLEWGVVRQKYEALKMQKTQESVGGIKEIKLLGKEQQFIKEYANYNQILAAVESKQNALAGLPRLWLETIGVISLVILVIVSLWTNKSPSEVVPTIILFAVVAFRILPSATRVLNSIQLLRYSGAVIDLVSNEFNKHEKNTEINTREIILQKKIELKNITYAYPDTENYTLKLINMVIEKGESVGIIGGSGAGKSTLIDIILGLLVPTGGAVFVDQVNINDGLKSWRSNIGYVPQNIFLIDDSLKKNIAFGVIEEEINSEYLDMAINAASLDNFVASLPAGLDTFVGERGIRLSGGQKQRIVIARALYHNPSVLVFDEATSSLDDETEDAVIQAINKLKHSRTLIIVAHRLSTIEKCDRVYRVENGVVNEVK